VPPGRFVRASVSSSTVSSARPPRGCLPPDSTSLLYTAADKKLYNYSVADGKTIGVTSSDVNRIGSLAVSPDSKWVAFSKQDRTLRSHVYIAPIAGGEERHVSDDRLLYSENNAVWTADGRYLVFTSAEGFSNGIATQGGINTTTSLYVLSLRDQERDPMNRDVDNEAQGLAAEAAARQAAGRGAPGGAGQAAAPDVRIDWNGLARRARRLTVPGLFFTVLTPAPDGHAVAYTSSTTAGRGGGFGAAGDISIVDVETGQVTRVPPAPPASAEAAPAGGGGGGQPAAGLGSGIAFARDGRTLYFRQRERLFAAPINLNQAGGGNAGAQANAGGRGGRGGGRGAAPADTPDAAQAGAAQNATARQVTYTANLEVDHKALRAQVFNEGWRIMKNRFYDAKMHGANWNAVREMYEPLLENLVDEDELHTIMMMMIGHLNASHTGVSGGPNPMRNAVQTRYPGFDLVADPSGYYKVGHIYKNGPADHDYFKLQPGHFIVSLDDHELKTSDDYWRYLTIAAGNKFHFLINDKPSKDGAWEVAMTPVAGQAFGDLQ